MSVLELDRTTPKREGGDSAAKAWLRALAATAPIAAHPQRTLPVLIEELADTYGDAPALLSDRETLTYRELAARANRYARWALELGVARGETVCLMMPNRPEYLAIWLGVTRVGGIVSLLNTSLAGAALAHCMTIVAPKHVIVAAELIGAVEDACSRLAIAPRIWVHGASVRGASAQVASAQVAERHPRIERAIERQSGARLAGAELRPVTIEDRALHIYTSGTTGLPKAANISHHRLLMWSHWFGGMMDTGPGDRMYDCLPMYHSVGGIVAIGAVLVNGGSVLIREKFSARQFWDDVRRFDCTLLQYIGELCRYLVQAPPHPDERQHKVRIACGNGLRPDVWSAFKNRFQIPQILEFYASTEGNFSLYNAEGEPGAIGRIPPFLARRLPTALIRFDIETGEPMRDADGLCIRCSADQVGEAIGRIPASASPSLPRLRGKVREGAGGHFEGYTSARDSQKKILRDAFEPGDAWFRTGDLMRRDERGFFYFVDRIGDTFRWKGENVATSEVAQALTECPGVLEANVYGVTVPHTDGRAGMAAIVVDERFDLAALRAHLAERLPGYARPLFLRRLGAMEVTATFKHKKSDLARTGFDPSLTDDAIYFNDAGRGAFVRLDQALYERIQRGRMRL
ncbi:MAG TPA: long-chain-acyl-CoA synthetase [Xanthobacteraceae bacterium]|nr:long-chain-acyl-CoA synthetase [Xanthobacteraceae bacterium]